MAFDVGLCLDQDAGDLLVTVRGRPKQCRHAFVVLRLQAGARLEQDPGDLLVTFGASDHEGSTAFRVQFMHAGTRFKQCPDDVRVTVSRSVEKRISETVDDAQVLEHHVHHVIPSVIDCAAQDAFHFVIGYPARNVPHHVHVHDDVRCCVLGVTTKQNVS